jgi:PAS domain S-box-containing protein
MGRSPDVPGVPQPTAVAGWLSLVREIAADVAAQPDVDGCWRQLRRGLLRLGFRRAGIWEAIPNDPTRLLGSWGTNLDGSELDEHGAVAPLAVFLAFETIARGEWLVLRRVLVPADPNIPFRRFDVEAGGPPNHASVALRAEGQFIGIISVDMLPSYDSIGQDSLAALELLADLVAIAIARGRVATALRTMNEQTSFLDEVSREFGRSLDVSETLDRVARLAATHIADWCIIEALTADGAVERLALAAADPSRLEFANEFYRWYRLDLRSRQGISRVIRTGRSEYATSVDDAAWEVIETRPDVPDTLKRIGIASWMIVPLTARGQTFGAITLIANKSARHYGEADTALAEELGRRAAIAIDNAKYEEALRQSEEQYRQIVETTQEGVWIFNAEGETTFANQKMGDLLGVAPPEMIRKSVAEFVHPEDVEAVGAHLDWRDGDHDPQRDLRLVRGDGSDLWVLVNASPLTDRRGQYAGTLAMMTDITQRRTIDEQLRQAQKIEAIGLLAGGVAHDFNNLLTVISGYGELLVPYLAPNSFPAEAVQQILKAGESAASLTRQLLAFSRRQVVSTKEIDLNVVVDQLGKMLRRLIGEDIAFVTTLAPALGRVEADPGQMEQVLLNLATNARDAMPRGGKLAIETVNFDFDDKNVSPYPGLLAGRYVMVAMHDTGFGMPPEIQARIFDPFFTTKAPGKGTGLGLAAVYGIVKQSGGWIYVDSVVGQGTVFRVFFPRVISSPDPESLPDAARVHHHGTETILVVEDARALRDLARLALERSGYTVLEAESGEAAVRIVEEDDRPIHLLLTDVVMPGLGGRPAAEKIQALRPSMKIIYMSGYTDDMVVRHGVVESGVAFLQKPFSTVELARLVRAVLDGGR